jgi:hypothetical protein
MRFATLMIALACLSATMLSTTPARAGAKPFSERIVWMGIGGAGGLSAGEVAGVGYLNFTLGLRFLPVVPEFTLREGIRGKAGAETHIGGVAAGARFLLPRLLIARGYFRVAFSHQHEVQWDHFLGAPFKTLIGVDDGINHRSGFETSGGVELKLGPKGILGLWVQGTLMVFPETAGPPVTAAIEGGLSIALGPKLGAG